MNFLTYTHASHDCFFGCKRCTSCLHVPLLLINIRSPLRLLVCEDLTICLVFQLCQVCCMEWLPMKVVGKVLQEQSGFLFQDADGGMVKRQWGGKAGVCVTIEPEPSCGFSGSPHNSSLTQHVLRFCNRLRALRQGCPLHGLFRVPVKIKYGLGKVIILQDDVATSSRANSVSPVLASTVCETLTAQKRCPP